MERKPINPWSWSIELGFDQAQLVEGHQRLLVCSGQDAVGADGNPQHPGDMAAQLELALDNLEAVLAAADMTLANIVRLNVYTRPTSTSTSSTSQKPTTGSGRVAMRLACSASRSYQHDSSSCWRPLRLTDPQTSPHQACDGRAGAAPYM
jgi:enamine deaminase RidA (YjgF/YER057c/UK114 family)